MKKYLLTVMVFLFYLSVTHAQALGDYQSKATGNWGDAGSWQTYDGASWIDAATAPTGASGTITIQSSHTINVADPLTLPSSAIVVVNGYLKSNGGLTATTTVPYSLTFNNGSTYEHAMVGGSIPMSTWNTGSTCLITGTTGTSPGNNIQPFYNFIWNCPGQTTNLNLSWDSTSTIPVVVRGDLTVSACGTPAVTYAFRMTNAATVRNIKINGNVIVNGGNLTVSGSSGGAQYNVTVGGNINISSGRLSLCGGSGGFGTWYLYGDFSCTGTGQFFLPSNKTIGTILFFSKNNGTQSFTYTSSNANQNYNYGVLNNSNVLLNSPIAIQGSSATVLAYLVLTNGKFVTSPTNIITVGSFGTVVTGSGYVDGPLTETVASISSTTLAFPLGKGGVYRPTILNLTQDAATSTVYTAELIGSSVTNTLPFALDAVATSRYVHIVKGAGANVGSATIQMNYDNTDGLDVSHKDNIRIAKDDGAGNWINLGGSGTADNTGNILSNSFGTSTSLGTLLTNDFIIAHLNPASVATIPTVSTNGIKFISTTFATGGGVISNDGNAAITAKGVCWNTSGAPTISDSYTNDGTTSAPFNSSITGLSDGTTYHVRAYATNNAGTGYGNDSTFITMAALTSPVIITNPITNIVNTSATGSGNISEWGGSSITDRGICWSTAHNPTITENDFNSVGAGGIGVFTVQIGGLKLGTPYYVRAYAINNTGISYGDEVSFVTPNAQPDVVKIVDQDGSGNYTDLFSAFNDVPTGYTGHWFIYVKNGIYYDKVTLASGKINVVLVGQNRDSTILTYDDYSGNNRSTHGVLSNGTSTSYSVAIDAADFQAQNITFRNTSNAYAPGATSAQAVALRTNGDRQTYYNCKMLGYQDTYYTQGGSTGPDRIYNNNCYVEGAVDFIFGRDVALFDSCNIFCNRHGGTLTAAATEVGYSYGYVFLNSTIGSTPAGVKGADSVEMTTFYLGRPWQTSPKTVFINCYEPLTVNAAGWTTMGPNPSLYSEWGCFGPGAVARPIMSVAWPGANQPCLIADTIAAKYTIANIFSKNNSGSGFTYAANWVPAKIPVDTTVFLSVLPVEITTFSVKSGTSSVKLNWTTATETNNLGFDIQRKVSENKTQNSDWQKIGFVNGIGNSTGTKKYSFTDKNVQVSGKYSYRLKQIDRNGNIKYSQEVLVDISKPVEFKLNQNYPNPFNPSTEIDYAIPTSGYVSLKVFDVIGNEVASLLNEDKPAGNYNVQFNASKLGSGFYIYQLHFGNFIQTKKMILLK